ncbi:3142_t:CDS:2 [Entrophospora sp. SA101]|nr:3142_t:CDS:2 [Entrophospora sp. SA101]
MECILLVYNEKFEADTKLPLGQVDVFDGDWNSPELQDNKGKKMENK